MSKKRWLVLCGLLAACGGSSSAPLTCTQMATGQMAQATDCHAAICQCSTISSTSFADRCADLCKKTQPYHCEQFPQGVVFSISNLACDQCGGIDGGASCP
jgi:hypothetical protein